MGVSQLSRETILTRSDGDKTTCHGMKYQWTDGESKIFHVTPTVLKLYLLLVTIIERKEAALCIKLANTYSLAK